MSIHNLDLIDVDGEGAFYTVVWEISKALKLTKLTIQTQSEEINSNQLRNFLKI